MSLESKVVSEVCTQYPPWQWGVLASSVPSPCSPVPLVVTIVPVSVSWSWLSFLCCACHLGPSHYWVLSSLFSPSGLSPWWVSFSSHPHPHSPLFHSFLVLVSIVSIIPAVVILIIPVFLVWVLSSLSWSSLSPSPSLPLCSWLSSIVYCPFSCPLPSCCHHPLVPGPSLLCAPGHPAICCLSCPHCCSHLGLWSLSLLSMLSLSCSSFPWSLCSLSSVLGCLVVPMVIGGLYTSPCTPGGILVVPPGRPGVLVIPAPAIVHQMVHSW
jgi:hypothetical protein